MTILSAILMFAVPGAVVAAALLAVGAVASRAERPERGWRGVLCGLMPPIVAVLAFWSADIGLNQFHPLWDRDGTKRYLAVALAAGLVGLIHGAVGRAWATAVLRGLLGAGAAAAVLSPLAGGPYVPWGAFAGLVIGAALWLAAAGLVLDGGAGKRPRLLGPAAMLTATTLAAPGLYQSNYAGGAMLFGSLSAMAGGLAVAMLPRFGSVIERSGLHTVWLALVAGVLLVTYGYTDVPSLWPLVIIAAAPFGLVASGLGGAWWLRCVLGIVAVSALAGGATVAAAFAAGDDGGHSGYEYDY